MFQVSSLKATPDSARLNEGQEVWVNVTLKVDDNVPSRTLLDNDVRVYHSGVERYSPKNQNHAFVKVLKGKIADLRLRLVGKPDGRVKTGENLTYTAVVENLGPSNAIRVHLRMRLISSGDFTFLDAKSLPGACVWGDYSIPGWGKWIFIVDSSLNDIRVGEEATCLVRLRAGTA